MQRVSRSEPYKRKQYRINTGWIFQNDAPVELVEYAWKPNPVSTLPVKGEYVKATPWKACYFTYTGLPYAYKYQYNLDDPLSWVQAEGRPLCAVFSPGIRTWGCANTAPYEPLPPAYLFEEAKRRAADKIRANDFSLGQSLGELPETVKHIVSVATRVLNAYKAARKLNWRTVSKQLKTSYVSNRKKASAGWLEYQFAWLPLLSDVHSSVEALKDGLKDPSAFKVVVDVRDQSLPQPPLKPDVIGEIYGTFKRGVKAQYHYSVEDRLIFDLERLGLMNPVSLAWELFPLSFVVDWFYNIGALLESLSLGFGLKYSDGFLTAYVQNSWSAQFMYRSVIERGLLGDYMRAAGRTNSMVRTVEHVWPHPSPYFRGFGNLGIGQLTSLIALLSK